MKVAVDWAIKKDTVIYDGKKHKTIGSKYEDVDKYFQSLKTTHDFYIEEGGADNFKLIAYAEGHNIFTVPGDVTNAYRIKHNIPKTDKEDATIIYNLMLENESQFYKFQPIDKDMLTLKLLFKEYDEAKKSISREKNRLSILKRKAKVLDVADFMVKKDAVIKAMQQQFDITKKQLKAELKKYPIYNEYFANIKGVGEVVAAGLISNIGRIEKFKSEASLRKYAGCVPYDVCKSKFNRELKKALFFFADGVVKHRTPVWRERYDALKIYYKKIHPDKVKGKKTDGSPRTLYTKGHINNMALRRIKTLFLNEVYNKMIEYKQIEFKKAS